MGKLPSGSLILCFLNYSQAYRLFVLPIPHATRQNQKRKSFPLKCYIHLTSVVMTCALKFRQPTVCHGAPFHSQVNEIKFVFQSTGNDAVCLFVCFAVTAILLQQSFQLHLVPKVKFSK